MNEGTPSGLSANSKRLLGIRDFEPIPLEQKTQLLGSKERMAALEAVDTTTMPRGAKREMKRGIVLELLKQGILSSEVLKNNPLVYIGSGTDVEYPLALGGRHIIMVDPILEDEEAVQELVTRVENLTKESVDRDRSRVTFTFDFGDGKEPVVVELVPKAYDPSLESAGYRIPDATGHIVLYATQGPAGVVSVDEAMKAKIVEGGAILQEAHVLKMGANHQEVDISLGRGYS